LVCRGPGRAVEGVFTTKEMRGTPVFIGIGTIVVIVIIVLIVLALRR
jgi:hypothetical protein